MNRSVEGRAKFCAGVGLQAEDYTRWKLHRRLYGLNVYSTQKLSQFNTGAENKDVLLWNEPSLYVLILRLAEVFSPRSLSHSKVTLC